MEYDEYARIVNYCKEKTKVALDDLVDELDINKIKLIEEIHKLIQCGCTLEYQEKESLSLLDIPDLYNKSSILTQISCHELVSQLVILLQVDSTNTYLKSDLFNSDNFSICIAEKQTNGRGRRGKIWHSPFGSSITFSIRKKLAIDAQNSGCISLIVGLSLISGLNKLGYCDLKIKWPNDLYFNHKKLAGILIETVAIKQDYVDFIVGIGINVDLPVSNATNIDQPWVNLSDIKRNSQPTRNIIISTIVNELIVNFDLFQKSGLKPFMSDWRQHDYLFNHSICIKQEFHQISGIAKGINSKGELLMERDSDLITINAGEISVRLADV